MWHRTLLPACLFLLSLALSLPLSFRSPAAKLAHVRSGALLGAAELILQRKCLAGLETPVEIAIAMATKTLGVATDAESEPVGRAKELMLQRLRATGRLISLRGARLRNSQTEREDEAESELRNALAVLQEATALSEWDAGSWIALGDTLGELMRLPSISPTTVVDHNGDGIASTYRDERTASYEYAAEAFAKNGAALPLTTSYALANLYLDSGEVRVLSLGASLSCSALLQHISLAHQSVGHRRFLTARTSLFLSLSLALSLSLPVSLLLPISTRARRTNSRSAS